jgi:hypothetical protein
MHYIRCAKRVKVAHLFDCGMMCPFLTCLLSEILTAGRNHTSLLYHLLNAEYDEPGTFDFGNYRLPNLIQLFLFGKWRCRDARENRKLNRAVLGIQTCITLIISEQQDSYR